MPCIKPVSDLRNYNEVLHEVAEEAPVFLTKNGRGCYAILAMSEYEKIKATIQLLSELQRGEKSARDAGWIDSKNVRQMLE